MVARETGLRTWLYARISVDDRGASPSPENQIAICERYASDHGLIVAGRSVDRDLSGALDEESRPGIVAALAAARHGQIDRLLVTDWDRLGRGDSLSHLRILFRREKVACVAVLEADQPELVSDIKRAMGAEYLRQVSMRVRSRARLREERRERMGGRAPYGYRWIDRSTVAIAEPEAERVRAVYRDLLDGRPIAEIVTRTGESRWRVYQWLRMPQYAGAYVCGIYGHSSATTRNRALWRVSWDHHEPIIPRTDWERAQAILDGQARRLDGRSVGVSRLPLSGLLYCACGGAMRVVGGPNGYRSGRGRIYGCERGCRPTSNVTGWTGALVRAVAREMARPAFAARLHEAMSRTPSGTPSQAVPNVPIRQLRARIRRLEDAILDPYGADLSSLMARLAIEQAELRRATEAQDRRSRADTSLPTLAALRRDLGARSAMLRDLSGDLDGSVEARRLLRATVSRADLSRDRSILAAQPVVSASARGLRQDWLPIILCRVAA